MAELDPPRNPDAAGAGRSYQTKIGGVTGEGDKICPSCEARYAAAFRACPRDGTALVATDDTVGTVLSGTYFVRRVLGEGAMGRVFEARHTRIPVKRFAIKMLHPEYLHEPQILARFAREAEAAATIDHPNVVGVVDVDRTSDGRPFIVTELLQGKDFAEYLIEVGKLPVARGVRIGLQIAQALAAAHALQIIHRDIKPENVFLTGDLEAPVAKVLDFGMSRLERREGKVLTQAGAVVGTPAFMPPEQARGDRVDHRADVYAVGALLYTALTGQRPFERESAAETLLAVLASEPRRPRELDPAIPEELERVILRAMAREPDDRYATMEELARALSRWGSPATMGDTPVPPGAAGAPATAPAQTLPDGPADLLVANAHLILGALLAAAFGWAAAALAAALSALARAGHGEGSAPTAGEMALVSVVVVAALVPPLYLVVRATVHGTWMKPAQAAAVVRRGAPSVLGALVAYGVGAAAVRGIDATFFGARAVWPGWDVLLLLLGIAGAATPPWLSHRLRPRPPPRRFG
jgi:serine/threonine-protein kinase